LIFTIIDSNSVLTAAITGAMATDDGNGGVYLNGNPINIGPSSFGSLIPFAIPAGSPFLVGMNTLDFIVNNGNNGTPANPSGLRVDDLVLTGVAVPQPTLTVSQAGNSFRVSWPASAAGFALQETIALPGNWTNSTAVVVVQGNEKVVLIPITGTAKFYRLRY
jgi:hypothetical protein